MWPEHAQRNIDQRPVIKCYSGPRKVRSITRLKNGHFVCPLEEVRRHTPRHTGTNNGDPRPRGQAHMHLYIIHTHTHSHTHTHKHTHTHTHTHTFSKVSAPARLPYKATLENTFENTHVHVVQVACEGPGQPRVKHIRLQRAKGHEFEAIQSQCLFILARTPQILRPDVHTPQ